MDFNNKRLYNGITWLLSLAVIGLFFVLLRIEWVRLDKEWQRQLVLRQEAIAPALQVVQERVSREALLLAELVANDKDILRLMRSASAQHEKEGGNGGGDGTAALRSQLYQQLLPYWAKMSTSGVKELNLILGPKGTNLLRVHRPDRFGDDLNSLRPMVVDVLNSGVSKLGMELEHYGTAYRALIPVAANDNANAVTIGAIEVGIETLQVRETNTSQGQAVLIHPSLVHELLWDTARTDVKNNSGNIRGQWGIEYFTHPVIKEWQAKGLLPDPISAREKQIIIRDQDKDYLLSVNRLSEYGDSRAPTVVPKVLVLTWNDITNDLAAHEAKKTETPYQLGIECLLVEMVLWLVLILNRRYVLKLLDVHSQQLQQERDLSEHARQRLTLALSSSESGFWEWDISNNRAIFSKEWRELCGLPPGDEDGADIEKWLERVHPGDKRASYMDMVRHVKGETPIFENEYRLRIASDEYKWIFTRGKVVERGADGKAKLMLGVYTDITERKKNEIIVIRQQAALHALNEIASVPSINAEEQLRRALAIGLRHLGLTSATVSHVVGNQYQLKIHVVPGGVLPRNDIKPQEQVGALSNYFCEMPYRQQDIFTLNDIAHSDSASHPSHSLRKIENYIGAPIWVKSQLYGTLCFESEFARHQAFDELDCDFVRLLSRWVGVTLDRWEHQIEQQSLLDKFNKLSNHLPGFLYQYQMCPDGTSYYPYVSAGIEEVFGVTEAEVAHTAEKVFAIIHPKDLGWVGEAISFSAANLAPFSATYRVRNPQRGERWVHAEARPEKLADGGVLWHGFVNDITEEKHAELKMQEINAMREAIFDAASISIISVGVDGLIKTFNRGAEEMLGYSADELIGLTTPEPLHIPSEIVARAEQLSKEFGREVAADFSVFTLNANEGRLDENEWTYVRKDGTQFPVILSITALRKSDGDITGYLGIARDISELKRIDRMKTEFISTVSHELRTPLTAISGSLGIIMSGATGVLPDTASKMLNIAHNNSLRLIHLVNDLLDMEKLVAGKMQFDMQAQPLLPIVQQSLESNAAYGAQYHVKYVLNSVEQDDLRITVDAQRLLQVLANFLSNAAKFSPRDQDVVVHVEKIANYARVTVIDKGPGIPDEFRSRIFQKFSQVDSSDSRQKGGTGLGLSICKEIIERMGGKIGFTSVLNQGSQFYFELPCEEIYSPPVEKHDARSPTGNRILVVDDDPEVAELIATMLRNHNYRVDIAYTGKTALERFSLYAYQALTIDLKLPDMDGITLIQQLRTNASTCNVPVVVLSANLDSVKIATKNNPMFKGVQWLAKPMDTDMLVDAVKIVTGNP